MRIQYTRSKAMRTGGGGNVLPHALSAVGSEQIGLQTSPNTAHCTMATDQRESVYYKRCDAVSFRPVAVLLHEVPPHSVVSSNDTGSGKASDKGLPALLTKITSGIGIFRPKTLRSIPISLLTKTEKTLSCLMRICRNRTTRIHVHCANKIRVKVAIARVIPYKAR